MFNSLSLRILWLAISVFLFHAQVDVYAICGESSGGGGGGSIDTSRDSDSGSDGDSIGVDRATEVALEALKERQEINWVDADFLGVIKGTQTEKGFEKAIKSLKEVKEADYNLGIPIMIFLESKKTYSKGNSGKIELSESAEQCAKIDKDVFQSSLPVKFASRFFLCLRIDVSNIDLDAEKEVITEANAPIVVIMNPRGTIKGVFIGKKCTDDKMYKCMKDVVKESKINLPKVVDKLKKYHRTTLMDIERKLYTARRRAHHISDHLLKHKEKKYKKGYDSTKKKLNEALAVCKDLESKRYEFLLYEYSILRKAGAPVEKPIP